MAFFSSRFYRDVGLNWKGVGFGYLILLLAICWIPVCVHLQWFANDYVNNKAPGIIVQIPEIVINQGEAVVTVAQPYRIIDPDSGQVLALIDTTGGKLSAKDVQAPAILTRSNVIIRKSAVETRVYSLGKIQHLTFNQETAWFLVGLFRKYAALILFPFAVLGSFVFRIVQVLIYGAIGVLFAKLCKARVPYQALVRLSVMAITPVIIVTTIVELAAVRIPFQDLVAFLAAMVYLFFAVKAVGKGDSQTPIREEPDARPQEGGS